MTPEIQCAGEPLRLRPAASRSVLRALVLPSHSDLFFLFFVAWSFLVGPAGWQRLVLDADTALHTAVGRHILATGEVPRQDPFSFSKAAEPWFAFEWLAETLFGWLYNVAGVKGVVLLAGMLIALLATILLKFCLWKGANGAISLAVTLLAANAVSIHYYARPHLFTLVFLAASIWLLEGARRDGGRKVWLLVPLVALWANLHGGFFLFLALVGLRIAGCAAEAVFWPEIRDSRRTEALRLLAVGAACGAASLVNPYGIHLHAHIVEVLRSPWIRLNVTEFQSPSFRFEEMFHFMALLFAGLASIGPLIREKRIVEPLWIVFLAYCSLVSVRHATIYAIVAAPVIACRLSDWWAGLAGSRPRAGVVGTLDDFARALSAGMPGTSLFIPAVIAVLAVLPGLYWPEAFTPGHVPVALVDRNLERLGRGRVFTSDQIADYLVFRNYPRQRVFYDSRHNYYGETIGGHYMALQKGRPEWRNLAEKYRFDAILCRADSALASLVMASTGWRLADRDETHLLFTRDAGGS